MSILVNQNSKVIVQGFTGNEGTFHASQMLEYGTKIVGGITPGKGGSTHLNLPVFNSVDEAMQKCMADVSIIFVPPLFAADAILEAIAAKVPLIVCITEGIPVADMVKVKSALTQSQSLLIGPNCPGIITSEECKIGIMPGFVFKKGRIGIVSKSGTLTYEAGSQIVNEGLGISTAIGIGGDPIIGISTLDAVKLFMQDKDTDAIVLIGEIGGSMETEAARWIGQYGTKPVVGFIAGQTAPPGKRMGHAGAIVGGAEDTASAKINILRQNGVFVAENPADIGKTMIQALKK